MCSRPGSTRRNSRALTTITAIAAGTTHEITIPRRSAVARAPAAARACRWRTRCSRPLPRARRRAVSTESCNAKTASTGPRSRTPAFPASVHDPIAQAAEHIHAYGHERERHHRHVTASDQAPAEPAGRRPQAKEHIGQIQLRDRRQQRQGCDRSRGVSDDRGLRAVLPRSRTRARARWSQRSRSSATTH